MVPFLQMAEADKVRNKEEMKVYERSLPLYQPFAGDEGGYKGGGEGGGGGGGGGEGAAKRAKKGKGGGKGKRKKRKDPLKPKQPCAAFIHFGKTMRAAVKGTS